MFLLPPYSPVEVTDVLVAFPGSIDFLLPDREEILPFDSLPTKWREFQGEWFLYGLQNVELKPKDGIDAKIAFRHLQCIQGSYAIKDEHKEQFVAFLASIWFTNDSTWERGFQ